MVFISHNLNLAVVKLPPLNCLNQSDCFFLLSLSVMTPFTACLPCKTVCLHVLYVSMDVCVCANTERIQPAKCVCVFVSGPGLCVLTLRPMETDDCMLPYQAISHSHTHTCTSQYTLKTHTQPQIPPQIHKHGSHTTFKLASKQTR